MKVAPSGLPTWRRWWKDAASADAASALVEKEEEDGEDGLGEDEGSDELRRKSCVMAMPMEAKEREVRSQARKVRSRSGVSCDVGWRDGYLGVCSGVCFGLCMASMTLLFPWYIE